MTTTQRRGPLIKRNKNNFLNTKKLLERFFLKKKTKNLIIFI